jgi:hypothetical protein
MKPRIRTIKPEIWRDPTFNELSTPARLLFIGLISNADDEGRLGGSDALLKGLIFTADDMSTRKFSGFLDELDATGMARRYTVDGKPYVDLPSWHEHQKINRPTPSTYPPHPNGNSRNGHGTFSERSGSET